ncbi:fluoride efflux transporter CrcB [Deferribacter autotrophicus]|uniref:Fluoride-specific ion channel FluC n=1 Tax=Deferribacter autotrophicus TaxID=500465 RepID=A0A5A8F4A5_9BACT|nr:fluoride efflux transporter CrcB [Deferribacter autotrophicus]KAA0257873.1 fluoride efflux transporter CrcB [Deferribacter autotrophicus]
MKILVIGLGGFIGAILRYVFSKGFTLFLGNIIPFGTLFVNVAGSFMLGYIHTLSVERLVVGENLRFFISVGMLGAFTTFSTFSLETIHLFEDGVYILGLLYMFLNLFLSLTAAFFGIHFARI